MRCARVQAAGVAPRNLAGQFLAAQNGPAAQVPAPHCPMPQPTGDAEGLGFHVPNTAMQTHTCLTHAHTTPLHGREAARSSACLCAFFAAAYGVALALQRQIVCMHVCMEVARPSPCACACLPRLGRAPH